MNAKGYIYDTFRSHTAISVVILFYVNSVMQEALSYENNVLGRDFFIIVLEGGIRLVL